MINKILASAYPADLVHAFSETFLSAQKNFHLSDWKKCSLDIGHFVEAARRVVENELYKKSTPIGKTLPQFNEACLVNYENQSGDEVYRILIPRVLYAVYCIRNKRGVGHLGKVPPNKIDSVYMMNSIKWVVAEILRNKSTLTFDETQRIVDSLVEREIPIIWKNAGIKRVLNTKLNAPEQVLVLLLDGKMTEKELLSATEYKNQTDFRNKVLKTLHKKRYIEFHNEGLCELLAPGLLQAERLALGT